MDVWRWLNEGRHDLFLLEAKAGRVNFLPMADDAVFAVRHGPVGLYAEPMNQAAQQAMREWN
ncbi:hypothetical protein D3C81_2303490 [compost metagenome]